LEENQHGTLESGVGRGGLGHGGNILVESVGQIFSARCGTFGRIESLPLCD
jgi:hypothetical protein